MRKIFTVLVLASLTLFSCSSDDAITPTPIPSSGSMSAKVDGTDWSASLAVQATKSNGTFQVSGSDNNAKQMNVTIMGYTGPGTYALGGPATSGNGNLGRWTAGLNGNQTYSTMVGQGEGTCIISSENGGVVEGSFNFTAKNTDGVQISITDGKFKANL